MMFAILFKISCFETKTNQIVFAVFFLFSIISMNRRVACRICIENKQVHCRECISGCFCKFFVGNHCILSNHKFCKQRRLNLYNVMPKSNTRHILREQIYSYCMLECEKMLNDHKRSFKNILPYQN